MSCASMYETYYAIVCRRLAKFPQALTGSIMELDGHILPGFFFSFFLPVLNTNHSA